MGREVFTFVAACADVVARGISQQVEQDPFLRGGGQEGVRGGVVLPERPVVADWPAFDGLARRFVAGVGGEVVLHRPAANTGAAGFKAEAALAFAGTRTVGGGRLGGKELGEQGGDARRPIGRMIAPGNPGRPSRGLTFGAGAELLAVAFVAARLGQPQFTRGLAGGEFSPSGTDEEVTDKGGGQTFDQW